VIYRRTKEEMPAHNSEIEAALAEGVKIQALCNPSSFLIKNDRIDAVECDKMMQGDYDESGRRKPVASGDKVIYQADKVILAIGQKLDCSRVLDIELDTTRDGKIKVDPETSQTSVPWIFSGGDCVTGPATVVEAVASGEKAAVGIDCYLSGQQHAFWRIDKPVEVPYGASVDPAPFQRSGLPEIPVSERKGSFAEVELPYQKTTAIEQCQRCLRCDFGKETKSGAHGTKH